MPLMMLGYPIMPLLIILAGSLLLTAGDLVAKTWVQTDRFSYIAMAFGLYMAGLVFLCWSFRFRNIAIASMILIILNVVLLAVWSWLVYGETLNHAEIAGLVLGLVAVVILESQG